MASFSERLDLWKNCFNTFGWDEFLNGNQELWHDNPVLFLALWAAFLAAWFLFFVTVVRSIRWVFGGGKRKTARLPVVEPPCGMPQVRLDGPTPGIPFPEDLIAQRLLSVLHEAQGSFAEMCSGILEHQQTSHAGVVADLRSSYDASINGMTQHSQKMVEAMQLTTKNALEYMRSSHSQALEQLTAIVTSAITAMRQETDNLLTKHAEVVKGLLAAVDPAIKGISNNGTTTNVAAIEGINKMAAAYMRDMNVIASKKKEDES